MKIIVSASESTGKCFWKQIFKNTYSKNHSGEETNDVTLIGKKKIQDITLLNWSKVVKIQDIAEDEQNIQTVVVYTIYYVLYSNNCAV